MKKIGSRPDDVREEWREEYFRNALCALYIVLYPFVPRWRKIVSWFFHTHAHMHIPEGHRWHSYTVEYKKWKPSNVDDKRENNRTRQEQESRRERSKPNEIEHINERSKIFFTQTWCLKLFEYVFRSTRSICSILEQKESNVLFLSRPTMCAMKLCVYHSMCIKKQREEIFSRKAEREKSDTTDHLTFALKAYCWQYSGYAFLTCIIFLWRERKRETSDQSEWFSLMSSNYGIDDADTLCIRCNTQNPLSNEP